MKISSIKYPTGGRKTGKSGPVFRPAFRNGYRIFVRFVDSDVPMDSAINSEVNNNFYRAIDNLFSSREGNNYDRIGRRPGLYPHMNKPSVSRVFEISVDVEHGIAFNGDITIITKRETPHDSARCLTFVTFKSRTARELQEVLHGSSIFPVGKLHIMRKETKFFCL